MASAWVFQDDKQVKKRGADAASWYVGWYDPDGKQRSKSCGPGSTGKKIAERLRKKREAELLTGTYADKAKTTWKAFRADYEEAVASRLRPRSRDLAKTAMEHFERLIKPGRVGLITTVVVDDYIAARRKERGQKRGTLVSMATVNKELRHIKAALRVAHEWKLIPAVPKFRMEKLPAKLATYVSGDDFARIYKACDSARMPEGLPGVNPPDWWRALLTTAYMTGWRIGDLINLRRVDLDLDAGTAITRGEDNKGKRDALVKLHPVVIDHLKAIPPCGPTVLPWSHDERTLWVEFNRIQAAAGINLPCPKDHDHTKACHTYGFHDLRRAFATMNADKLSADALQALMRHKSYTTTQGYINLARQMDQAVDSLHVPDVLKKGKPRKKKGGR